MFSWRGISEAVGDRCLKATALSDFFSFLTITLAQRTPSI
jgi:hypothetical protein